MAFPWVLLFYAAVSSGQQSVIDVHVTPELEQPKKGFNSSLTAKGTFSLKTIFEGPTFIITIPPGSYDFSQARVELKLTAYYADRGLRSIVDYANFQSLHQQLLTTPHTSGLAYPDVGFNNEFLLSSVIKEMVIPDGFRTIDILYAVRRNNTHVLYLAPTDFFINQGFSGLKTVGRFLVDAFSVEPIFSNDPSFTVKPNPLTEKIQPKVNPK
ncbi:uncharacterized protein [Halyomorpha halys]|uniref:uncharacterized protein n=1 Tax=Halyomorpha halys TaxID=286706 RepID=UPI0006D4D05B|nr:uncharacterized protein LOC106689601 [Halyomorpha halys]